MSSEDSGGGSVTRLINEAQLEGGLARLNSEARVASLELL